MRLWNLVGWLAVVATAGLTYETFRLAAIAGRHEVDARQARAALAAATAATAATPPARGAGAAPAADPAAGPIALPSPAPSATELSDFTRLAQELAATKEQLAIATAMLAARARQDEERAQAAAAATAAANRPIPAGVRECLVALQDCLRAEGYAGLRLLRADAVGAEGLTNVELLDAEPGGIDVAFVRAARVTGVVERATGGFVLTCFDGERSLRGERTPLPPKGLPLRFADVDGRMFEARLPYFVRGEGEYPAAAAAPDRPPGELDPLRRRQWLERLERVLTDGGPTPRWRVGRLRGLDGGWFQGGDLVATDDKRRVVASAACERFAIEVDEAAGIVSLLLRNGSLRRDGVDSSITGEGLRVLLPNLTCKQASDAMFGMVVRR
jgi:hypothetical protein